MREQTKTAEPALVELGAATELTQGSYLPGATEAISIKDHWDEP